MHKILLSESKTLILFEMKHLEGKINSSSKCKHKNKTNFSYYNSRVFYLAGIFSHPALLMIYLLLDLIMIYFSARNEKGRKVRTQFIMTKSWLYSPS